MVNLKEPSRLWKVLGAYGLHYSSSRDHNLPLAKFAYDNYHASIGMSPYEAYMADAIEPTFVGMN